MIISLLYWDTFYGHNSNGIPKHVIINRGTICVRAISSSLLGLRILSFRRTVEMEMAQVVSTGLRNTNELLVRCAIMSIVLLYNSHQLIFSYL